MPILDCPGTGDLHDRGGGGGSVGISSTHPSALKPDWSFRYGKPLISPGRAALECLSCIFTSSLTAALPWQQSWSAQILSALAWAQVARASDYARMAVMHALHRSVRRVYSASLWSAENTVRAVYAIMHHQSCARHNVITQLIHWLYRHAQWRGTVYTDAAIPVRFRPEGYEPVCAPTCRFCAPGPARSKCLSCIFLSHLCVCVCVCVCVVRW